MTRAIVLDSGPLGLASNPKGAEKSQACNRWLQDMLDSGILVYIPEIADFEVMRELIRAGKSRGVARLNMVLTQASYLAINTPVMRLAAELWAKARERGTPTADPKALDADVILAAQALLIGLPESDYVVASDNVGHLSQFVPTARWQDIEAGSPND